MGKITDVSKNKDGRVIITTETLAFDVPNANGHLYPKDVIEKALEEYQYKIDKGQSTGGLFIDNNFQDSRHNIKNTSHLIESMEVGEENVYAKIKVLNTPRGKDLLALLESNDDRISIGSSYLIDADVKDNVVKEGAKLISIDFVMSQNVGE